MTNMSDKKIVVKTGGSTTTTLGIVFIVLKLVGVIDWSWFWVLAPFWIPKIPPVSPVFF